MKEQKSEPSKMGFTQTVVKNAFFQSFSGIISKIGGMIFTIIVARMLFPELFGLYSLALAMIITLTTFTDLGLGNTITRYIAESLGRKNKKQARSRFLFLVKFKVIITLIISILLFLFAGMIASIFKKPDLALLLQIGSIYLFIISVYGIIIPLFLALQKLKYSALSEIIFQTSKIALIFIFLYFYKTVASVFAVLTISLLFALIFSFAITYKKYPFLFKGKKEPVERKRLLTFSGFLALSSISIIIFANIDKLMLGYFLEANFIGYYAAIITLIGGVLGLVGFSVVVFPVFVQLKAERLKRAFKKTFRLIAIIAFPATIGLAYILIPLMQVLYGSVYVPVQYHITLIITSVFLSLLILESVFSGLYYLLFNAKEKPKFPAISTIFAAVLNVILNIVFIFYLIKIKPEYGLIGAAAATAISRYSYLFMLVVLSRRKLNMSPDKSAIFKPLTASILMLAFLFVFDYFVGLNILTGIIMILSAVLVYFGFMWLIKGVRKEDFELVRFLMPQKN